MRIVTDGQVTDSVTGKTYRSVSEQVYIDGGNITANELMARLKFSIIHPVFRVCILNSDETVREDISNDVVTGSLSVTYQNGQRRTLSLTLDNSDGRYTPKPIIGKLWNRTRISLEAGILYRDTVYWTKQGVFVVSNPSITCTGAGDTITISMGDKFSFYDGTAGGKTEFYYRIPVDTSIYDAITGIIRGSYEELNMPYDVKPIIMPEQYMDSVLAYTITQDPDTNLSEMILSLAEMISCDVFYDRAGHLTLIDGADELAMIARPYAWRFSEEDSNMSYPSFDYSYSDAANKVVVKGNVVNGYQFSAEAVNDNPASSMCRALFGEQVKYISDTNLYSDNWCQNRADYELIQASRGCASVSFTTNFIPTADVNELVCISYPSAGIVDEDFLVNSLSMTLEADTQMNWSATNIRELPYMK